MTCPACAGTGYGKGVPVCGLCLGQLHIAIDRTKDGGIPDGYLPWREWDLGDVPRNPLRLTYEAKAQ